ncbi:hypothetical protein SLA2020_224640 [Shorea laevis]
MIIPQKQTQPGRLFYFETSKTRRKENGSSPNPSSSRSALQSPDHLRTNRNHIGDRCNNLISTTSTAISACTDESADNALEIRLD